MKSIGTVKQSLYTVSVNVWNNVKIMFSRSTVVDGHMCKKWLL